MNPTDTINSGWTMAMEKLDAWSAGFFALLPNLFAGMFFFGVFFAISLLASRFVKKYFIRKERSDLGRLLSGFFFWAVLAIGFLIVLTIVIPSMKPVDLLASFGFGSLAFGFAFKDILQNWLAGLLILLRLPFRRGDQIVVNDVEGTVLRIEPRATILRTYDGRDIIVPNTTIYTNTIVVNTSQELRRVELSFTVGYSYNIRQLTEIIEKALDPIEEIKKNPPIQILCWNLGATSLEMKIRWWIDSERSQEVISRARLIQAIKEAFDANNIDPTDPQLIYYKSDNTETAQEWPATHVASSPPPRVEMSGNDPEADQPKQDSKHETMLSHS